MTAMADARFITAIGTPLTEDDRLHVEGLTRHIDDQAEAGIDSLLVAGTMGLLPMQTDTVWQEVIAHSIALNRGRFEMLVGATDTSTPRALERIDFVNTFEGIEGVVVMAPGVFKFTPAQYVSYFSDLADASRYPLYLYDLEPVTGVHLSVDTVLTLAEHPNIAGIKLSGNVPEAVRLSSRLNGSPFRLIIAEPSLSDMLFRHGYAEHLDGIYAIAPHWAASLVEAVRRDDWDAADAWQWKLTQIKELFLDLPFSEVFTALMNLRGIPGRFAPRPMSQPDAAFIHEIRQRPVVRELLAKTAIEA